jgi:hypothetical protein
MPKVVIDHDLQNLRGRQLGLPNHRKFREMLLAASQLGRTEKAMRPSGTLMRKALGRAVLAVETVLESSRWF